MKKNFLSITALSVCIMFGLASCEPDESKNNGNSSWEDNDAAAAVINNYVDNVVISTYASLKEATALLLEKVEAYAEISTQANLDAACAQWKATRKPWEQSEAFLFGPIADQSIDPHLDSWPLSQTAINALLGASLDWENEDGASFGANTLGFHTLEYLLFFDGENRQVADLFDENMVKIERTDDNTQYNTYTKEAYLGYVNIVAQVLRNDALHVYMMWVGTDNASDADNTLAEELELPAITAKGYQYSFKNPDVYNISYANQQDAIYAMIDGMIDIATEVADAKIGEPYDAKDIYGVESWYSFNSFTDYTDNILSIQKSFNNGNDNSLASYLKTLGATSQVDAVNADITTSINALEAAAATDCFRNYVLNYQNTDTRDAKIDAAIEAIGELTTSLTNLKPMVKTK